MLPGVQDQVTGRVEQATAGIGVLAQGLPEPVLPRNIEHQAVAALRAAAGVVGTCGNNDQVLLAQQAGAPVHFEIEFAGQTDHHLRVLMAVSNYLLAVMTQ